MNGILICEGSTDYSLLQYYMRQVFLWRDEKENQNNILKMPGQRSRRLLKDKDTLTIMAAGGCSRLSEGLSNALDRNFLSSPGAAEIYEKIVIITDRDEAGTESAFIESVKQVLLEHEVSWKDDIVNNCWISCEMENCLESKITFSMLLMVIPFEENGAMETFLLKCIADNDIYDKRIIDECGKLVDKIDPEKRYLTGRRIITKAKFDTYFSIRTPAEQFLERQNILKNVKWEQYSKIQKDFRLLGEL